MLIRDPLYGDISLSSSEESIINTRSFNRLRNIKQLSFSEYIYPGATHNRFSHSIGVCHIASKMFDVIQSKTGIFDEGDKEIVRQIALCHDLGHSPFSHSSEELSSISHEKRMYDILKLEQENLASDIDISTINMLYNHANDCPLSDKAKLLGSIMDNFIDADKIDYLYRDAYFCGLEYGKFDRDTLINSLSAEIVNGVLRLVIEQDGVQALENMIFARYYMFNQVYFHPKRRLYDILFLKYMKRSLNMGKYPNDTKKFLAWDDTRLVQNIFKSREFRTEYKLICDIDTCDFTVGMIDEINQDYSLHLIGDFARKSIVDGLNKIYIKSNISGTIGRVEEYSPLLSSLGGKYINKFRVFAPISEADKAVSILGKNMHR